MSDVTAEEFLALAGASRLLPSAAVVVMRERIAACTSKPDYLDVASQWILEGLLTAWQVERLVDGHGASLVLDKYKLIDQVGHGGMGVVFKAEHLVMGRQVALKMLFKAKLDNPTAVARFHREVRALGKLDHPNIVVAHDAGRMGDVHYLVMEYIEGRDLSALGKQWGRLPIPWACEFIRQAAFGLQHAHDRGMIHRDVKPANLLVTIPEPGARPVVKVLDLGLAKFSINADEPDRVRATAAGTLTSARSNSTDFDLADDEPPSDAPDVTADGDSPNTRDSSGFSIAGYSRDGYTRDAISRDGLTQDGHILGTPDFLAPEQVHGLSPVDGRTDVFSLGCTLFKLLTGELPFGGDTVPEKVQIRGQVDGAPATPLRRLLPEAPPGLEVVLATMLARDAVERYQTPAEVAAALEPFCAPRGGWDRRATADANAEPSSISLGASYDSTLRNASSPTPPALARPTPPRPAPAPAPPPQLLAPLPWLDPAATPTMDLGPFDSAAPATRPSQVTRPVPVVRPIASAAAFGDQQPSSVVFGGSNGTVVGPGEESTIGLDAASPVNAPPPSPSSLALAIFPAPASDRAPGGRVKESPILAAESRRATMARRRRVRKLMLIFAAAFGITLTLGLISHAMRRTPGPASSPASSADASTSAATGESTSRRPLDAAPGGSSSADEERVQLASDPPSAPRPKPNASFEKPNAPFGSWHDKLSKLKSQK